MGFPIVQNVNARVHAQRQQLEHRIYPTYCCRGRTRTRQRRQSDCMYNALLLMTSTALLEPSALQRRGTEPPPD
jgi:hypothetical protein